MIKKLITEVGLFEYSLKLVPETYWAIGIAAITYLAQALPNDWETAQEPSTWAATVAAGLARVVLGVLLGKRPTP